MNFEECSYDLPRFTCFALGYHYTWHSNAATQADRYYQKKLSCGYIEENNITTMVEVECSRYARDFDSGCVWTVSDSPMFDIEESTTIECVWSDEDVRYDYKDYYGEL
eukprot:sb/3477603/